MCSHQGSCAFNNEKYATSSAEYFLLKMYEDDKGTSLLNITLGASLVYCDPLICHTNSILEKKNC